MSDNWRRAPEIGIPEVAMLLSRQMEGLCSALALDGRRDGHQLFPRNPTRRDRNPGSFVIELSGRREGRWDDYATGDYGDALDLVAYVNFGGWPITREAKREAFRWAKRFLGLGDASQLTGGTPRMARIRADMEERKLQAEASAERELERLRRRAQAVFLGAHELEPGTPGWTYLREARGIPLEDFTRLPWAVKWKPAEKHVETGREVPVLISALLFPDGGLAAIHRVFLEDDGRSKIRVDTGVPQKKIWPRGWNGAAVPISRGKTGLSPREALAKGLKDENAYAEGVENAFTVAAMAPEWRTWATGTSGNFANVEPPECADKVIVCRDNEWDRKVRKRVSEKVGELRAKCEARGLFFAESWPGRAFKDWNDQLRGERIL